MRSNPLHMLRDRRRSDEGFTLIELLVVVVILGILIGIAIPVYLNYRKSANDKAAQSDVRGAVSALEVCNTDSAYPTTVNETTGAMAGCATASRVQLSTGTTVRYVLASDSASYTFYAKNAGGTGNVYCYSSSAGGGVKAATGTALASATC